MIASGLSDLPGRWAPRDIRWVALGAGAAALVAGAVFIVRSGPPWPVPAAAAAAVAVALLIAVAAVSRAAGDSRAGAVLGFAAVPYAFLAGLLAPARSAPLVAPGRRAPAFGVRRGGAGRGGGRRGLRGGVAVLRR